MLSLLIFIHFALGNEVCFDYSSCATNVVGANCTVQAKGEGHSLTLRSNANCEITTTCVTFNEEVERDEIQFHWDCPELVARVQNKERAEFYRTEIGEFGGNCSAGFNIIQSVEECWAYAKTIEGGMFRENNREHYNYAGFRGCSVKRGLERTVVFNINERSHHLSSKYDIAPVCSNGGKTCVEKSRMIYKQEFVVKGVEKCEAVEQRGNCSSGGWLEWSPSAKRHPDDILRGFSNSELSYGYTSSTCKEIGVSQKVYCKRYEVSNGPKDGIYKMIDYPKLEYLPQIVMDSHDHPRIYDLNEKVEYEMEGNNNTRLTFYPGRAKFWNNDISPAFEIYDDQKRKLKQDGDIAISNIPKLWYTNNFKEHLFVAIPREINDLQIKCLDSDKNQPILPVKPSEVKGLSLYDFMNPQTSEFQATDEDKCFFTFLTAQECGLLGGGGTGAHPEWVWESILPCEAWTATNIICSIEREDRNDRALEELKHCGPFAKKICPEEVKSDITIRSGECRWLPAMPHECPVAFGSMFVQNLDTIFNSGSFSHALQCNEYRQENSFCFPNETLPDGNVNFDIKNCGQISVFKKVCNKTITAKEKWGESCTKTHLNDGWELKENVLCTKLVPFVQEEFPDYKMQSFSSQECADICAQNTECNAYLLTGRKDFYLINNYTIRCQHYKCEKGKQGPFDPNNLWGFPSADDRYGNLHICGHSEKDGLPNWAIVVIASASLFVFVYMANVFWKLWVFAQEESASPKGEICEPKRMLECENCDIV